ncbi:tape measure protein [Gordonia phage Schmidt]|uniref:Tape measure protein n=1 Tax=Gordonia phage Schmidt TaxID=2301697 RepID=A0A385E062_9CAUD|nr:tail length tape measure protein [Gordonia phage Schmidt]AXQ65140.1 tape measure protein [Gordonia phage Schmidt]
MADDDAVWVPVLPSMRGFAAALVDGTGAASKSAAQRLETDFAAAGQRAGKSAADGIAKAQKDVERATDKLVTARNREQDAAGKVRVAEAQLQELREKGVTSGAKYTAAVEKLETAKRNETTASDKARKAADDLTKAETEQKKATDAAGDAAEDAAGDLDEMGEASGRTGEKLKKFGVLAAGALAAAGAALFKVGSDFTNMQNTIRVGTGATGEALDGMVGVAKNLGSQVPASFEDIGSTVADLNTRLGLTGEPLERLSRQFLELSNMGIDADINKVSQAFSGFGISGADTEAALDSLFQVSQATGLSVTDLATSAVKAGPQLRQFGFGLAESAALAGQLDKNGMDADKTLASMSRAMIEFAKNGEEPQKALYGTVVEIEKFLETGEDAKALDLAGKLFGTRGAGQFVDAVKSGAMSVDDFVSATGATSDTIMGVADETRTFSEQFEMFKNDVLVQIEPIATRLFGVLTDGMGWVTGTAVPAVQAFTGWLAENKTTVENVAIVVGAATIAFGALAVQQNVMAAGGFLKFLQTAITSTKMWTAGQWLLNTAMSANPIGIVIAIVVALVAAIVLAYKNSETFRNIVSAAWNGVKAAVSAVWEFLKGVFEGLVRWFTETLPNAASTATQWITDKWNALLGFFQGLPGKVTSALSGMWDGLKEAFRGALNWIIEKWNNFSISMKIPDNIPLIGGKGFTIDTPDLPLLATGGVAGAGRRRDGLLYGPGTGTSDSILGRDANGVPTAMVSAGEFVVNAAATKRHMALLQALNAGMLNNLPGLAEGGAVSANDLVEFAKGVEGASYDWGGVHWGDCSGAVSALANYATGRDPWGSRFATGSEDGELKARGFKPGLGPSGSLNIGWFNGGPYGGHTAATLPNGVNFEMGGARGDGQYGGQAAGADDPSFTDHAHLPPEFFGGLDAGAPTIGADAGVSALGGGSATGGTGTGSGSSAGGSGSGTAVYVTNWPESSGGTGTQRVSTVSGGGGSSSTIQSGVPGVSSTGDRWKPEGSWFEDPQAAALDALFEVLNLGDVLPNASELLPDKVSRYGVAGSAHAAPVGGASEDNLATPANIIGTVVHGDMHVTDYDEFRSRQERDEKNAQVKAGM